MGKTLGGSLFIRNAIRFGYCLTEALDSLYALCDELSILECGSDDGTQDLLQKWVASKGYGKRILVEYDHPWEVGEKWDRLAILANVARAKLTTQWHFMLQADEVLHESAIPVIRNLIEAGGSAYFCRRLNLFVSPDMYIKLNLKGKGKPCGDTVCRLAKTDHLVFGDGESIAHPDVNALYTDRIIIFHYGYVREGAAHIAKAIDMQSWFFGPGSQPDQRIVKMRDEGNVFHPEVYFTAEDLDPIPIPHPTYSTDLAARLRAGKVTG